MACANRMRDQPLRPASRPRRMAGVAAAASRRLIGVLDDSPARVRRGSENRSAMRRGEYGVRARYRRAHHVRRECEISIEIWPRDIAAASACAFASFFVALLLSSGAAGNGPAHSRREHSK